MKSRSNGGGVDHVGFAGHSEIGSCRKVLSRRVT